MCSGPGPREKAGPTVRARMSMAVPTTFQYYGKKGARDTLIKLRLAKNCLALDGRIIGLLEEVGVHVKRVSLNRNYEKIETALVEKVARPLGLSGRQLDRILFQNYGDIMVRLRCP
jgi:hypothetical protein